MFLLYVSFNLACFFLDVACKTQKQELLCMAICAFTCMFELKVGSRLSYYSGFFLSLLRMAKNVEPLFEIESNLNEARESQSMAYEDQLSYEKQMQWRFLMQPIYQAYWLKKKENYGDLGASCL